MGPRWGTGGTQGRTNICLACRQVWGTAVRPGLAFVRKRWCRLVGEGGVHPPWFWYRRWSFPGRSGARQDLRCWCKVQLAYACKFLVGRKRFCGQSVLHGEGSPLRNCNDPFRAGGSRACKDNQEGFCGVPYGQVWGGAGPSPAPTGFRPSCAAVGTHQGAAVQQLRGNAETSSQSERVTS